MESDKERNTNGANVGTERANVRMDSRAYQAESGTWQSAARVAGVESKVVNIEVTSKLLRENINDAQGRQRLE